MFCGLCFGAFFVAIYFVNKKESKQVEMRKSVLMIIGQSFCQYCSGFQMDSLNTSSKQKKEKTYGVGIAEKVNRGEGKGQFI